MSNPKINPPQQKIDIIIESLGAICIIYLAAQLIVEYLGLNDKIPTHFGSDGMPNAWGNKSSLLIPPTIALTLYAGLTILNRFPHLFNFPLTITEQNAERQYQYAKTMVSVLKLSIIVTFTYIQIQTINVAKETNLGLGSYFISLIVIGSFLPIIIYFIIALKNK